MKLVIGNKAYSSWSFRPWIAMRHFGIPFEEEVIALNMADTQPRIRSHGGGLAPTVPILIDGDLVIWETIAIIAHLVERFPNLPFWPEEPAARAFARAIAAEMHGGFAPFRQRCPMNFRRKPKAISLGPEVAANVDRIVTLWMMARQRYGAGGPFLFGAFSAADAMYAPVVNRLHVYAVPVPVTITAYIEAMMALPAWQEWATAALAEPWSLAHYDNVA